MRVTVAGEIQAILLKQPVQQTKIMVMEMITWVFAEMRKIIATYGQKSVKCSLRAGIKWRVKSQ